MDLISFIFAGIFCFVSLDNGGWKCYKCFSFYIYMLNYTSSQRRTETNIQIKLRTTFNALA